jgi:hypothetical protein
VPEGTLSPFAKSFWLLGVVCAGVGVSFIGEFERGGWFFMFLSFLVVAFDPRIVRDRKLLVVVCLVVLAHHIAVLVNAHAFTLPGGEYDANTFNHYAGHSDFAERGLRIGMRFYVNFLALFHIFWGDSVLTGGEVSVMAFVLSCLIFVRIVDLLGIDRHAPWLVLIFGLLPSMVIFSSLTLREPFELLLLLVGVYGGLRAFLRPAWWAAPACIGSLLAMGLFHQLLLLYALVAAAIIFMVPLLGRGKASRRTLIALSGVAAAVVIGLLVIGLVRTPAGDNYLKMAGKHPIHSLVGYRETTNKAQPRTAFTVELSDASVSRFVLSAGLVYVNYLFAPFPWRIAGFQDVYACGEALMRAGLLIASFLALYLSGGDRRRALLVLLLLYGSMTAMWAMGTTNYGQGLRHHVLTNWMLFLSGAPLLISRVEALLERKAA